jgi:hypothetical protein
MLYEDVDWEQAACRGTLTDMWYVEGGSAWGEYIPLRKVCNNCPILSECAEYAIRHEQWGFWAGMAPRERMTIRSRRGIKMWLDNAA